MIIHSTNIFASPLIMIVWAIDIYLFLASVRFVTSQYQNTCNSRLCQGLKLLIDPIPNAVDRRLARFRRKSSPSWLPWLIVILFAVFLRHLLIWIVITVL